MMTGNNVGSNIDIYLRLSGADIDNDWGSALPTNLFRQEPEFLALGICRSDNED